MKKIKNSVQSIRPDVSVVLMCVTLVIACPIRVLQMTKNMDATTGFFLDYSSATITILYALLAVSAVLMLLLNFLSARVPAAVAPAGRRIPLGLASFVFGASLFYDAIKNYLPDQDATATIVQDASSVTLLHHVRAVFAFLSCCYFIVFAISYISGKSFHKKLKILSLAPLAWAIIGVLERIKVIISIMRVSELFLELASLVFLMAFFLSFARVVSEVNSKDSMWSVIACGCISAMVILTYTIPRIMLYVTANSTKIVTGYDVDLAAIGCALFILVFVVTVLRSGYSVEDVAAMNEEIEAANAENNEAEAPAAEVAEEAVTEETEVAEEATEKDVIVASAPEAEEATEE